MKSSNENIEKLEKLFKEKKLSKVDKGALLESLKQKKSKNVEK